jgi:hypothetical protein
VFLIFFVFFVFVLTLRKQFLKLVDEIALGPVAMHLEDESDHRLFTCAVEVDVSVGPLLHVQIYTKKDSDGKETFDVVDKRALRWKAMPSAMESVTKSIKRLSFSKTKEKDLIQSDVPEFVLCEWLWGSKQPALRICSVEPRIPPSSNSSVVA